MLDAHAWGRIAGKLSEEDFTSREHRLIYRAIAALAEASETVDILTVENWLKECRQIDNAGGLAYLASIANNTPSAANVGAYAGIVREHADSRRRLAELDDERKKILKGGHGKHVEPVVLPVYRRLSDVQARPIRWLWQGRMARGKVSMIAGHPGRGKSQITASMAAIITTGGQWPVDRTHCEQGSVVFLSAEDSAEDTIKPRLEAAGADTRQTYVLDAVRDIGEKGEQRERTFNLARDLPRLGAMLEKLSNVAMVVIDPITAYLGGTDSHKNADIRALLAPLSKLAEQYEVAVVCVSHLNKGGGSSDALLRVTGSLAFVAASRAAFIVANDPDNSARRLFLPAKNNLGNDQTGLAFTIESHTVGDGIETSRVAWEAEPVVVTADQALAPELANEERSEREEAAEWLRGLLVDGPLNRNEVKRQATQAGMKWATVRRAKDTLGIKSTKTSFDGGWEWAILPKMLKGTQDAQSQSVSTFAQGEHLRTDQEGG
jgi:replicative DNA helicase